MSARDPFGIDPDLGVRARRGLLSRAEQRELERATDASASLRIGYEVGRDLDGVTAVRGGDDALIANAANEALRRVAGESHAGTAERTLARRSRQRWSAAAVVLAVLAVSGAAAALWSSVAAWVPAGAEPAPSPPAPAPARRGHGSKSASAPPSGPAISAAPIADEGAPLAGQHQARAPHKGAAELFHAANAARREGAFARAVQLYAELRSSYPEAAESELARVSLGQLLLARGDAIAAEREFARYLARGRGQLVEEALLGRAQSLERMGRAREERASLSRLLTEFPHSVYAAQARARLQALERGPSSSPH
jgi:TolA-binding protein